MFHPQQEQGQPSCRQNTEETDTDSDESEYNKAPDAPLTPHNMQTMLRKATTDIKSHLASELDKRLSGIKEDIESLTSRTNHMEARIKELTTSSQAHSQDSTYLHAKIEAMEESLEDLNNRSQRNNIQIRGLPEAVTMEGLHNVLKGLFKSILPEASAQDLLLYRAHRALRPQGHNGPPAFLRN
ncbi:Hypothetical predicted protein [Pelobates cultripes]|uniref:Uncharacterized protein n=1 Tax=Pelobates cultripes TaxID=61616 RepID=A0AAD1WV86_PELCU|nr:Hypothetical predicted protein [Pelobates cultripes]